MCWNVEVSLFSAAVGWVTCALLVARDGPRDRYYARYLFTYTFTQLADIALWALNDDHELKACPDLQLSVRAPSATNGHG